MKRILTLALWGGAILYAQNALERQLQCADAGSTDTYACSIPVAPAGYVTGQHYRFMANTVNTGAASINFNSLGAKTIKKVAGGITTDLATNDIRAGQWVDLVYDGTNMQMQSTLGNASSGGTTFDPTDMTTEIWDRWGVQALTYYPNEMQTYNGSGACATGAAVVNATGQDPAGSALQTGASTNDYCMVALTAALDNGTAMFPDWVSSGNFKAFTAKMRLNPTATTSVRIRFGVFASYSADPQGLYLEYDSSVGSTWRCVVNDGSATSTDTTVTATTSRATLSITASATGTLTCSVNGSTPVNTVDTFPAVAFWGYQIKTLTTAAKVSQATGLKLTFTGLTR